MNLKNIIKAGLIAGLVICLSAASMVPVVGTKIDTALAKFNLPPFNTASMLYFFLVSLSFGIVLIWIYAAILPRFNNRLKSLIISVFIVWFLGYLLANLSVYVYGFLPLELTIIGILWGLGELLIAGLIAGRFYKE